jgi:hypothetical protein
MVTPEDFHTYLMALKDAGAVKAKIGADYFEVEFAQESEPAVEVRVPSPAAPPIQAHTGVDIRPGYSELFGLNTPKFVPATE